MYLPPNSIDLFGIEHRGESFEHAADLVRFVLLNLEADPGFPAFIAGTFVFFVFVLAVLWRYSERACVWVADVAVLHDAWRLGVAWCGWVGLFGGSLSWLLKAKGRRLRRCGTGVLMGIWSMSHVSVAIITCKATHRSDNSAERFKQARVSSGEFIAEIDSYHSLIWMAMMPAYLRHV
jgi:hypothetical protein